MSFISTTHDIATEWFLMHCYIAKTASFLPVLACLKFIPTIDSADSAGINFQLVVASVLSLDRLLVSQSVIDTFFNDFMTRRGGRLNKLISNKANIFASWQKISPPRDSYWKLQKDEERRWYVRIMIII